MTPITPGHPSAVEPKYTRWPARAEVQALLETSNRMPSRFRIRAFECFASNILRVLARFDV